MNWRIFVVGLSLLFPLHCMAVRVADELTVKFSQLAEACFSRTHAKLAFMPARLLASPPAQAPDSLHIARTSFEVLANFLYSGRELTEAFGASSGKYMNVNELVDSRLTVFDLKHNNYAYNFSCTSALKSVLDLNIDIPLSAIKAAFKADLENKADAALIIVYGRFQTAISRAINSEDFSARVRGNSAIWLAASANPAALYYLDWMEGWLVATTTAQEAAQLLNAQGQARVSALALSADWTADVQISYGGKFRSQEFDVYAVSDGKKLNYSLTPIPTIALLGKELEQVSTYSPDILDVVVGMENEIKVVIPNLAKALCGHGTTNEWSAKGSTGVLGLVSGFHDGKQCVLLVKWRFTDSSVANRSAQLTLTNVGHKIAGKSVEVEIKVPYRSATYPTVIIDIPSVEVLKDRFHIIAEIRWGLAPGTTQSSVKLLGSTLRCPSVPERVTQVVEYVDSPSPKAKASFDILSLDEVPKNVRCGLTMDFSFSVGQGPPVRYQALTQVAFPPRQEQ